MYSQKAPMNLKHLLLDYLNGERPDYEMTEAKIMGFSPLEISDMYSNVIKLTFLETQLEEEFSSLNPLRFYNLKLNTWKFCMKRTPGVKNEFFYDIVAKDYE